MTNTEVSNWLRQVKHRAKRRNIYNNLELKDLKEILESYDNTCAYCGENESTRFDIPFPGIMITQSNVLPICDRCKSVKRRNDMIWMLSENIIDRDVFMRNVSKMMSLKGGDLLKQYINKLFGG